MSDAQQNLLPHGAQNRQLSASNGTADLVGSDREIQEQMAQIAKTIQRKTEQEILRQKQEAENPSLVKQVAADPSVLFSFVNWEHPGRTLASLVTTLSLIISTRYFSPISWIAKILCIVLGATSTLELFGRATTKNTVMSRVRPQPYYRPSEATYSRLFSEIHEGVNLGLVKLQRIIFVEDLTTTGIAFILTFVTYWIIQVIPLFWLAIGATVLFYTVAPMVVQQLSDPNAPSWKPIIQQKVQDAGHSGVDTVSAVTSRTLDIAQNLSSKTVDAASSTTDRAARTARDLNNQAMDTASSATDHVAGSAQNLKNQTVDTVSSAANRVTDTTQDLKNKAVNTASSATKYTANTAQDLKKSTTDTASYVIGRATEVGRDATNRAQGLAYSTTNGNTTSNQGHAGKDSLGSSAATEPPADLGYDIEGLVTDRHTQHPVESSAFDKTL